MIYDTEEQIGIAAGNYMCGQVLAKPNAVLGLATGSTPLKPYNHMIRLYEQGAVDFSKVTTFNLDEYCKLDVPTRTQAWCPSRQPVSLMSSRHGVSGQVTRMSVLSR